MAGALPPVGPAGVAGTAGAGGLPGVNQTTGKSDHEDPAAIIAREAPKVKELHDGAVATGAKRLDGKLKDKAGANLDVNLKTKYTRAGERAKGLLDEAKPLKRGNRKSLKESAARILTAYGKAEIEMAKGTLPAKAFENHKGDLVKGINNIAINGGDKELELADEVSKSILPLIADPKSKLASALNQIQQQIEAERKKATTPQAA